MRGKEPTLGPGEPPASGRPFLWIGLHAAPVSLFVLGLFTYSRLGAPTRGSHRPTFTHPLYLPVVFK